MSTGSCVFVLVLTTLAVVRSLTVSVSSTTATTISLSWSVPDGLVVREVVWEKDTSEECPDKDEGSAAITDGSTSYTIRGLEEGSRYTITVTATNTAGNVFGSTIRRRTSESGNCAATAVVNLLYWLLFQEYFTGVAMGHVHGE